MTQNLVVARQVPGQVDTVALAQLQQELNRRVTDLRRLRVVLETLSQSNEARHFAAVAMALCNHLAARWNADRVSLGFLKGRYVRLLALSHTEKFTRQMQLVQDLEGAMEECLDQDVEIQFPPPVAASQVSRAAEALAVRHGPGVVCSFPLRRDAETVAVVTLERKGNRPFAAEDLELIRLTCDLVTPRLLDLYERDRWLGAKAAAMLRLGLAAAVGSKHTWAKAAAILMLGLILFATFVKGTYNVEAPCVFEATDKQVVTAPFDSYLRSVEVAVGDSVVTPTGNADNSRPGRRSVLAILDTSELENKLASAQAERQSYGKQADIARRDNKFAEAQAQEAMARKAQAEVDLLERQIRQATLVAPVTGVVFTGDLRQKVGMPVRTGDVLFEVGRPESLRADLSMPEDQVFGLKVGMTGELATAAYPGHKVRFQVERIYPVAEVVGQKNIFKVRVRLDDIDPSWMRPGMEGVAKIHVGRECYGWLWTHGLVNWIRMKIWM